MKKKLTIILLLGIIRPQLKIKNTFKLIHNTIYLLMENLLSQIAIPFLTRITQQLKKN